MPKRTKNDAEMDRINESVRKSLEQNVVLDHEIYAMSPDFRIRNEANYVLLYGCNSSNTHRMSRVWAIVLALLDGKRTVRDVAELVLPFAKQPQGATVFDEALMQVKAILSYFLKSRNEHLGSDSPGIIERPHYGAVIPAESVAHWRGLKAPLYDPMKLLPKNSPPASGNGLEAVREPRPVILYMHPTSACSTDCRYCYLNRRPLTVADWLSKERVFELIQECVDLDVPHLEFTAADPLLYPHLFELLDVMSAHQNFTPMMLSTKSLIRKETAARLAQYPLINGGGLQISLDSTVGEVAAYLTRTPGYLERAMESLENCLEAGLPVYVKAVVTPYNILTIPTFYREMKRLGVKYIRIAGYARSFYHHTDDLFNDPQSFKWLENEIHELEEEFGESITIQNGGPDLVGQPKEGKAERFRERSACSAGRSSFLICADGKVIPCEQMNEVEENFCGDLKRQSLMEVWNSRELIERTIEFPREKFKGTPCETCEEWKNGCLFNKGYCIRDQGGHYGRVFSTPFACPEFDGAFIRTQ